MPLDIQFIFTANPEDYTNRGNIVTPLKDRIGSQILTHYPKSIEISRKITDQENRSSSVAKESIHVPELAKDLIEQLAFEARDYEFVDTKSGVSARLTISAYEYMLASAERRMYQEGKDSTTVRISDFLSIIPAVNGKLELVYEGEQEGSYIVVLNLIGKTIKTMFNKMFPVVDKKKSKENHYAEVLSWFEKNKLELENNITDSKYSESLYSVNGLDSLVKKHIKTIQDNEKEFYMEFILHGISENSLISKKYTSTSVDFKDLISDIFKGQQDIK